LFYSVSQVIFMAHSLQTRTLLILKPETLTPSALQTAVAQVLERHERVIRMAIVAVAGEQLWVEVGLKSDGGV
jgi:hypothetical protein